MTTEVTEVPRHPDHTRRLLDYIRKSSHPARRREMRLKDTLLFMDTDRETVRRSQLWPLNAQLDGKVEVDEEGNIYYSRWSLAGVVEHPKILGQQLPPGKTAEDYHLEPPDKTPRKLVFPLVPQGIEEMVRVADHTLKSEQEELSFLRAAYGWVRKLRWFSVYFSEMNTEGALNLRQQGVELASQLGLENLRDPHKKKIGEMISKGVSVVDEKGNVRADKNFIAGFARQFGVELRALKRRDAVHAARDKYILIKEEVGLDRQFMRQRLEEVVEDLDNLLMEPNFSVNAAAHLLADMSSTSSLFVTARPYILGVRKAIEHWGYLRLPPGTIAEKLRNQRSVNRTHALLKADQARADKYATVLDFLNEGRLEAARWLIGLTRDRIFKAMLDKNREITVKQGNHGGRARTVEIDGTVVRQARERLGRQPEQVAIGISPYYLSKIEGNERIRVGSWIAKGLAKTLKIPRKDLVLKPQT